MRYLVEVVVKDVQYYTVGVDVDVDGLADGQGEEMAREAALEVDTTDLERLPNGVMSVEKGYRTGEQDVVSVQSVAQGADTLDHAGVSNP